ncbi:glycine--tRNA ligase, partial [Candidatus Woesebacteria bacterium]|nr:glycine--tRNA ligase [Candidatus Woesebacteria bacterium]
VYNMLKSEMTVAWDARGNIGKRYAAQDEIGTPYCITVDFDSLDKNDVTVRNRDTGEQERVSLDTLLSFLQAKIK